MPKAAKTICPGYGCRSIVPAGTRCERHEKQRHQEASRDRGTSTERGYTYRWNERSKRYRTEHPLCVPCQLKDRIIGTECVDHIVPRHSCAELFWDEDNWCSMCWRCHSIKTRKEPRTIWIPRKDRLVICGLPGTGKTTLAKELGLPYWDADDYGDAHDIASVQQRRNQWIAQRTGSFTVIVASPLSASLIACSISGLVRHLTSVWVARAKREV